MPTCHCHPLPYQADPTPRFARIRHAPGAVLLDSGRPAAERGRYDLMSAWPLACLKPAPDESAKGYFARLRTALHALGPGEAPASCPLPFTGGLIGYLSYDFGRRLERLPEQAQDDLGFPDARLGLYAWALISDHELRTTQLMFHPALEPAERERLIQLFSAATTPEAAAAFRLLAPFRADQDAAQYQRAVGRILDYIRAGDCYQVNYAQRFRAACQGDAWQAYRALRAACPTPFSGFLGGPDGDILSHSPERFVQVRDSQVESRPIKGTRPRGATPEEDSQQAGALLASAKDRAENVMIVDLLRNDLGRSCRPGSVRVPELFALESYPNVHHLVSAVTGTLAADKDTLDLLAGSFPGGSITGAPKIRAMQIIDELEPTRRALYCGSLLYLDVRGNLDSSIAIRSLLVRDGQISCWGGGGIVMDSDWQAEYEESIAKVEVLLRTLEAL